MQQLPHRLFKQKLTHHNLSPQQFAKVSGMPLAEVKGLLSGQYPFTVLRANHLAAVFNTKPEIWLLKSTKAMAKMSSQK